MTIYELLRLLAVLGWRESLRIGRMRVLVHPDKPWVRIILKGRPSERLTPKKLARVLQLAGITEGPR